MIGQGALRECLLDRDVTQITSVVRAPTGQQHAKLREVVHRDFTDFTAIESDLTGVDACFWCLGVASAGMTEESYSKVTYEYTMAAARPLARLNPRMTFVFISGASTDSTEKGSVMWARVKGRAENGVLALFESAYAVRPGIIRPMHGIKSRTTLYRIFYVLFAPLMPLAERLAPGYVTTTEKLGRAMLLLAKPALGEANGRGYPKRVLETEDVAQLLQTVR